MQYQSEYGSRWIPLLLVVCERKCSAGKVNNIVALIKLYISLNFSLLNAIIKKGILVYFII